MGRNNQQYQQVRLADRTPHYGLRKLSIGVASVLLSTTLYLGTTSASADTVTPGTAVTTGATTGNDGTPSTSATLDKPTATATEVDQPVSTGSTESNQNDHGAGTENNQPAQPGTEVNKVDQGAGTEVDQPASGVNTEVDRTGQETGTEVNKSDQGVETEIKQTAQAPTEGKQSATEIAKPTTAGGHNGDDSTVTTPLLNLAVASDQSDSANLADFVYAVDKNGDVWLGAQTQGVSGAINVLREPLVAGTTSQSIVVPNDWDFIQAGVIQAGHHAYIAPQTLRALAFATHQSVIISHNGGGKLTVAGLTADGSAQDTSLLAVFSSQSRGGALASLSHDGPVLATSLDLTNLDVSRVTDMSYAFSDTGASLQQVIGLDHWDTSHVENMHFMFGNSGGDSDRLSDIGDLSGWDTHNVTNMHAMFMNQLYLTGVGDLSHWNVAAVTDSESFMDGFGNSRSNILQSLPGFQQHLDYPIDLTGSGVYDARQLGATATLGNVAKYPTNHIILTTDQTLLDHTNEANQNDLINQIKVGDQTFTLPVFYRDYQDLHDTVQAAVNKAIANINSNGYSATLAQPLPSFTATPSADWLQFFGTYPVTITAQTPVSITIKDLGHPDQADQVIKTTVNWTRTAPNGGWSLATGDQPWRSVDHLTGSLISYQGLQLIYDTSYLTANGQHRVVGSDTSGNLTTMIDPGSTIPVKWTVQLGAPVKTVDVKLNFRSTVTDRVTGQPINYLNDVYQHRLFDGGTFWQPDDHYHLTATRQADGSWAYQIDNPDTTGQASKQSDVEAFRKLIGTPHAVETAEMATVTTDVTVDQSATGEPQTLSIGQQAALQPVSAADIAKQSMFVYYDDDLQQVIGYATPASDFVDGSEEGVKLPSGEQSYYYTEMYGVPLTLNPDPTKYELVRLDGDAEVVKQVQQGYAESLNSLLEFGYDIDGRPQNRLGGRVTAHLTHKHEVMTEQQTRPVTLHYQYAGGPKGTGMAFPDAVLNVYYHRTVDHDLVTDTATPGPWLFDSAQGDAKTPGYHVVSGDWTNLPNADNFTSVTAALLTVDGYHVDLQTDLANNPNHVPANTWSHPSWNDAGLKGETLPDHESMAYEPNATLYEAQGEHTVLYVPNQTTVTVKYVDQDDPKHSTYTHTDTVTNGDTWHLPTIVPDQPNLVLADPAQATTTSWVADGVHNMTYTVNVKHHRTDITAQQPTEATHKTIDATYSHYYGAGPHAGATFAPDEHYHFVLTRTVWHDDFTDQLVYDPWRVDTTAPGGGVLKNGKDITKDSQPNRVAGVQGLAPNQKGYGYWTLGAHGVFVDDQGHLTNQTNGFGSYFGYWGAAQDVIDHPHVGYVYNAYKPSLTIEYVDQADPNHRVLATRPITLPADATDMSTVALPNDLTDLTKAQDATQLTGYEVPGDADALPTSLTLDYWKTDGSDFRYQIGVVKPAQLTTQFIDDDNGGTMFDQKVESTYIGAHYTVDTDPFKQFMSGLTDLGLALANPDQATTTFTIDQATVTWQVHLKHLTQAVTEHSQRTVTLHYQYADGPNKGQAVQDDAQVQVFYTRQGTKDLFTKQTKWQNWAFDDTQGDAATPGYHVVSGKWTQLPDHSHFINLKADLPTIDGYQADDHTKADDNINHVPANWWVHPTWMGSNSQGGTNGDTYQTSAPVYEAQPEHTVYYHQLHHVALNVVDDDAGVAPGLTLGGARSWTGTAHQIDSLRPGGDGLYLSQLSKNTAHQTDDLIAGDVWDYQRMIDQLKQWGFEPVGTQTSYQVQDQTDPQTITVHVKHRLDDVTIPINVSVKSALRLATDSDLAVVAVGQDGQPDDTVSQVGTLTGSLQVQWDRASAGVRQVVKADGLQFNGVTVPDLATLFTQYHVWNTKTNTDQGILYDYLVAQGYDSAYLSGRNLGIVNHDDDTDELTLIQTYLSSGAWQLLETIGQHLVPGWNLGADLDADNTVSLTHLQTLLGDTPVQGVNGFTLTPAMILSLLHPSNRPWVAPQMGDQLDPTQLAGEMNFAWTLSPVKTNSRTVTRIITVNQPHQESSTIYQRGELTQYSHVVDGSRLVMPEIELEAAMLRAALGEQADVYFADMAKLPALVSANDPQAITVYDDLKRMEAQLTEDKLQAAQKQVIQAYGWQPAADGSDDWTNPKTGKTVSANEMENELLENLKAPTTQTSPWTTAQWRSYTPPVVAGYTPTTKLVAVQDVDHDTNDGTVTINYTADPQATTIQYVDVHTHQVVATTPLEGVTDQTVAVKVQVPVGYQLHAGQDLPTDYTFKATDNQPVTVLVDQLATVTITLTDRQGTGQQAQLTVDHHADGTPLLVGDHLTAADLPTIVASQNEAGDDTGYLKLDQTTLTALGAALDTAQTSLTADAVRLSYGLKGTAHSGLDAEETATFTTTTPVWLHAGQVDPTTGTVMVTPEQVQAQTWAVDQVSLHTKDLFKVADWQQPQTLMTSTIDEQGRAWLTLDVTGKLVSTTKSITILNGTLTVIAPQPDYDDKVKQPIADAWNDPRVKVDRARLIHEARMEGLSPVDGILHAETPSVDATVSGQMDSLFNDFRYDRIDHLNWDGSVPNGQELIAKFEDGSVVDPRANIKPDYKVFEIPVNRWKQAGWQVGVELVDTPFEWSGKTMTLPDGTELLTNLDLTDLDVTDNARWNDWLIQHEYIENYTPVLGIFRLVVYKVEQQPITRTIVVHNPDGTTTTIKQTATLERVTRLVAPTPADVDHLTTQDLTNQVQVGDWTRAEWDGYQVKTVPGYVATMSQVGPKPVQDGDKDVTVEVSYVAQPQTVMVNYVDDDADGQVVTSQTLHGTTDQTVTVPNAVPEHYLVVGANPTSYTFKVDNPTVTVHLKHDHQVTTETKQPTVTATITGAVDQPSGLEADRWNKLTQAWQGAVADWAHTLGSAQRTVDTDLVTNHTTYGDWAWTGAQAELPTVAWTDYYPVGALTNVHRSVTPDLRPGVDQAVLNLTVQHQPVVDQISFVDDQGQAVGEAFRLSKLYGHEPADIYLAAGTLPVGWQLAPGEADHAQLTFEKPDGQGVTVHVVHQTVTVTPDQSKTTTDRLPDVNDTYPAGLGHDDLNQTLTRTINVYQPDGTVKTITQTVTRSRTATVDEITKAVSYGAWTPAQWNVYIPMVPAGYTASQSPVLSHVLDANQQDETVDVTMTANPQTVTVQYVDSTDPTTVVSHQVLSGHTNETVAVPTALPAGWQAVDDTQVPTTVTLTADDHQVVTIVINHRVVTVTPDQPKTTDDALPNNPTAHYPTGVSHDDLISTQTRDVVIKQPGQVPQTVHQTGTSTRTAVVDEVTGAVTYGDWTSVILNAVNIPIVPGYTADIKQVPSVTITGHDGYVTTAQPLVVTYTPNKQTATIEYWDADGQVVHTTTINGHTDETVAVPNEVPAGWELASDLPATVTMTATGTPTVTATIKHHMLTIDADHAVADGTPVPGNPTVTISGADQAHLTKTVIRTIVVHDPTGKAQTTKQAITLQRKAAVDAVDGTVTYGDWSTAQWQAYQVPNQAGYTASQSQVPITAVTGNQPDQTVVVTYTPQAQTTTLKLVDETGQVIKTIPVHGVTDQTVPVHVTLPAGWEPVDAKTVPTSVIFGATGTTPAPIVIKHQTVTVTADQPQANGTPISVNPAVRFTGVTEQDLNQTKTRLVTITLPDGRQDVHRQVTHLHRDAVVDAVYGTVSYQPWSTDHWASVKVPTVPGYTADVSDVPAVTVTDQTPSEATPVAVHYHAQAHTATINYVDASGQTVHSTVVTGVTDQTVAVPNETPAGWVLDKDQAVPSTFTFGPTAPKPVTVTIKHGTVTVTADQPLADGTPLPNGSTKRAQGLDHDALSKQITRTIVRHLPDGTTKTVKQTVQLHRGATVDTVTGLVSYQAWSKGHWDAYQVPVVPGYHSAVTTVANQAVTGESADQTVTITYTADQHQVLISYEDVDGTVVGSQTLSGQTGETVTVPNQLPTGYRLADDQAWPETITFADNGHAPVHLKLVHQLAMVDHHAPKTPTDVLTNTPSGHYPAGVSANDLNQTVTRLIKLVHADGTVQIMTQTASLSRDATVDLVTGTVSYQPWSTAQWAAYEVPSQAGYTADQTLIPAAAVDQPGSAQTVTVRYLPSQQTATVNYQDETGQVVHTTTITGHTGETISVPTELPAGWVVTKGTIPMTLTFAPTGTTVPAVVIKHGMVTVTADTPKTTADVLPDNPTKHYPVGLTASDLQTTRVRTITVVNPDGTKQTVAQKATLSRTATVDEVTGTITYSDWSTALWPSWTGTAVPGYTTPSVAETPVTVTTNDQPVTVHYHGQDQTITVHYQAVDGTVVKTQTLTGKTGETLAFTSDLPTGWVATTTVPATVTVGADNPTLVIGIKHGQTTKTEARTVTRTVTITTLAGTVDQRTQPATLHRTVTTDLVTGKQQAGAWTPATWPALTVPSYAGYQAVDDQGAVVTTIPAQTVGDDHDQTVKVHYQLAVQPTVDPVVIEQGQTLPDPATIVSNRADLPSDVRYQWLTTVDTSQPGQAQAALAVVGPDGQQLTTVVVAVTVQPRPAEPMDKPVQANRSTTMAKPATPTNVTITTQTTAPQLPQTGPQEHHSLTVVGLLLLALSLLGYQCRRKLDDDQTQN